MCGKASWVTQVLRRCFSLFPYFGLFFDPKPVEG